MSDDEQRDSTQADAEPPPEERRPGESLQDYVDRRLREEQLEREAEEL